MRASLLAIIITVVLVHTTPYAQEWTFDNVAFATYFGMAVEPDGTPHLILTNCTHRELCFGSPAPRYLIHAFKPGSVWMYDTVAVDPAGLTPAITLDDTAGVHIAYMDSLTHLHYIYGRSGGPWTYESPPHAVPDYFRNEPDIAVDDTNGVHISYNERERPWYQYRSATGWIEESVSYDYADNDIARTSIKVGSDGIVRIAYWSFDYNATLHEKTGGVWTRNVIGGNRGQFPSLALDANNAAHILHRNFGGVAYATNVAGSWTEKILHPDGGYGDIVLTADEVPIVAYPAAVWFYDDDHFYDVDLYVSVRVDSFWQRESLVSLQTPVFNGVGSDFRPRLGVDDLGMLHIAYHYPGSDELIYGYRDVPTGVGEPPAVTASRPQLRTAPNPFNPSTTLYYSLPNAGRIRIDVFDVSGRPVRNLVDRVHGVGPHTIRWDGRNTDSVKVSSGVYFLRLASPAGVITRRSVLIK